MNTKNMDIVKNIEGVSSTTNNSKDPHPCKYCSKQCYGLQCKDCHLKMEKELSGECYDCKKTFRAKKPDGKMRKRCRPCQEIYTETHVAPCKTCGEMYHQLLDDGRKFDQCYKCYQSSRVKCTQCENTTIKGKPLCVACHKKTLFKCTKCDNFASKERPMCVGCYKEHRSEKSEKPVRESHDCSTKGCKEKTSYQYCRTCNYNYRSATSDYMISTCQAPDCGYRGKGDFKFCVEHKK